MDGIITPSVLVFFQPTFVRRNRWQMTNYMQTVVYKGLQDIENTGVFYWLKKGNTRLVARSKRLRKIVRVIVPSIPLVIFNLCTKRIYSEFNG